MDGPFDSAPIEEIALHHAPLVKVVTQVRFPKVPILNADQGLPSVQQDLRDEYPILRQQHSLGVVITSEGATSQPQTDPLWLLRDKAGEWQVSLTNSFVALETTSYTSRTDFISRFERVLSAIERVAEPVIYDRVGLRYINRLEGQDILDDLPSLVRPEVLAAQAIPLGQKALISHSLCDSQFVENEIRTQVRWGILPPFAVLDPTTPATSESSWILDIDIFVEESGDFSTAAITSMNRGFGERAYRFFRWVVTPDFLQRFGGDST